MKSILLLASLMVAFQVVAQPLCHLELNYQGNVQLEGELSSSEQNWLKSFGASVSKLKVLSGFSWMDHVDETNKGEMAFGKAFYPMSAEDAKATLAQVGQNSWVKLIVKVGPKAFKTFLGRLNNQGELSIKGKFVNKLVKLYPNWNYVYAIQMESGAWNSLPAGINTESSCFPQTAFETTDDSFYSYVPGAHRVYQITDMAVSADFIAFERTFSDNGQKELFVRKRNKLRFSEIDTRFPSHLAGLSDLRVGTNAVEVRARRRGTLSLDLYNAGGELVISVYAGNVNGQYVLSKDARMLLTLGANPGTTDTIYSYKFFEIF